MTFSDAPGTTAQVVQAQPAGLPRRLSVGLAVDSLQLSIWDDERCKMYGPLPKQYGSSTQLQPQGLTRRDGGVAGCEMLCLHVDGVKLQLDQRTLTGRWSCKPLTAYMRCRLPHTLGKRLASGMYNQHDCQNLWLLHNVLLVLMLLSDSCRYT